VDLAKRVLDRWAKAGSQRTARIVVKQNGRVEFPLSFLKELVRRVVGVIPGAKALPLVQVEFRERGMLNSGPNAGAEGLAMRGGIIHVRKTRFLPFICETIAHEVTHLIQYHQQELVSVKGGNTWQGEFWPLDTPYAKRPWETEAEKLGSKYGAVVYAQLKAEGLLQPSLSETKDQEARVQRVTQKDSPTFGDLSVLPDDMQIDVIRKLRLKQMTDAEAWDLIQAAEGTTKLAQDRWAKARTKGIPVKNKDTDRTVYVLPETLKEHPGRFQKVPPDKAGDPRWRGKPKPPARPRKPEKPEVPRDPPPAPIRPPIKKKPVKLMKPVTEVPEVSPMKVPEPSPPRRWKKLKRLQASEAVVERYLASLNHGTRGPGRS